MAADSSSRPAPFMLLFRNAGPETHAHLSPAEKEAMTKKWNDWFERLAARGKVQHGHPLALKGRMVSCSHGQRVTEGPVPKTKEVIDGYFFLTVADLDEATEIAKGCPGLPFGVTVEVRPIAAVSLALEGGSGRERK
jgi:hypothetical protein